jgi:23S rRNA pseudouridine2605 synthase
MSEGLLIITNDGLLARVLELPKFKIARSYNVRVYGSNVDEKNLDRLRQGVNIAGVEYGPYPIEVLGRNHKNSWLRMKLFDGKNNEIRRVMERHQLRVSRLLRTTYGPYNLHDFVPKPLDITEVSLTQNLKALVKEYQMNSEEYSKKSEYKKSPDY